MRAKSLFASIYGISALLAMPVAAQTAGPARADTANYPAKSLASRLDLDRYKATIKGLTQFGDRRQGTDRNANAVTWIEQQLKSYGCSDVERIVYDYQPAAPGGGGGAGAPRDSAAIARQRANQAFGAQVGG